MKLIEQHKELKKEINENLSTSVKQLQHEISQKIESSPSVTSDSDVTSQFISVIEAAFVHGLKLNYYEKRKDGELYKPQFWNLISKIGHKDSLTQVRKLNWIKSSIGRCRAWLRLALNESALSSYLSSLLLTSEYKATLNHYYLPYALFNDTEQADIFLRYLQGAESLNFDLSFNSFVLNSWTRTPLEIAGVIAPSLAKKVLTDNNNGSKPHSNTSSPWLRPKVFPIDVASRKSSSNSNSDNSRRESLMSMTLPPPSPTGSVASIISNSLPPAIHILPTTVMEDSDLVEVTPDAGIAPTPSHHEQSGRREETGRGVVHRRHLVKRRRKRSLRMQSVDLGRLTGSWGSVSSNLSNLSNGYERNTSRTNSISSNTPRSPDLSETSGSDQYVDAKSEIHSMRSSRKSSPTSTLKSEKLNRSVSAAAIFSSTPTPTNFFTNHETRNGGIPSAEKSHFDFDVQTERRITDCEEEEGNGKEEVGGLEEAGSVSVDGISSHDFMFQVDASPALPELIEHIDDHEPEELAPDCGSFPNAPLSPRTQMSDSTLTEEIDIYANSAMTSSMMSSTNEGNGEESFSCTPGKGSYGNSLLCAVSWSSENKPSDPSDDDVIKVTSLPVTSPPVRSSTYEFEKYSNDIADVSLMPPKIIKEDYLQKKDTLLFWRTRWFKLTSDSLTYYKDKSRDERLETIFLKNIKSVNDSDIQKNKSIKIVMEDGTNHQLAAQSREVLREWSSIIQETVNAAKILQAVPGMSVVPSSPDSTFEVLETSDVVSDHLLSSDTNTSWHSTMTSHLTKIANEKGLDAQNYQCADCAAPIGIIYGQPRPCNYTGRYYCLQCHHNDEHFIPARMIHNWDFRKHKVANRSRKFLVQMWREPCINMDEVNPAAYRHLSQLKKLLPLRLKLYQMQPYLKTCSRIKPGQLSKRLKGHYYMMENPHTFSPHDLYKVQDGDLYDIMNNMVSYGLDHVTACDLCLAKGFLCEICKKDEVIFAFQSDKTTQCDLCKGVFHKNCLTDQANCPRCERRCARLHTQHHNFDQHSATSRDDVTARKS